MTADEKRREYHRKYRETHAVECAASIKAWRERNPEKVAEYNRQGDINRRSRMVEAGLIVPKGMFRCTQCGMVFENLSEILKGGIQRGYKGTCSECLCEK